MAREINLVPSIKFETIKAIKIRNFILFLCIAVSIGCCVFVFILGTILGGQSLILDGKDKMLDLYSKKITSYDELTDFLTIKDQLGKLKVLADNRNVMSRTFNLLPVLVPTNGDAVNFSKATLSVEDSISLSVEGQANALTEPFIDYNVLDALKKSMDYMRYDYGRYVNELDQEIPAYCIIETDQDDGSYFRDGDNYYAYWTVKVDGCDPRHPVDLLEEDEEEENDESEDDEESDDKTSTDEYGESEMRYTFEAYNGQEVVKIWRTPQFEEWYADEKMDFSGKISGIPHFESECISYEGVEDSYGNPYFRQINDECYLVKDGVEGFRIEQSSNGRNQDQDLVLSFRASILIDPEYFKMQNYHMVALGPSGRFNVTDSYMQVQSLFVAPVIECDTNDTACNGGGKR